MSDLVGGFVNSCVRVVHKTVTPHQGMQPSGSRNDSIKKVTVSSEVSVNNKSTVLWSHGAAVSIRKAPEFLCALWPLILGITFGRAGVTVAAYNSYRSTDAGLFTDGATLLALGGFFICFVILVLRKTSMSDRIITRIMYICVACECLCVIGVGSANIVLGEFAEMRLCLCAAVTFFGCATIFYWLRCAKGTTPAIAAIIVFVAISISEVELYLCALLPETVAYAVGAVFVLLQYPCMVWESSKPRPCDISGMRGAEQGLQGFVGSSAIEAFDKRFLFASAVGVGLLSIVIGFLRSYPGGLEISFTPPTRLAYVFVVIAMSAGAIVLALTGRQHMVFAGVFAAMGLLACVALVLYGAFPDVLELGAVFTTALNALMVAFAHYVAIFFMGCGWRDPYYYAIAGHLIWMGCRALTRVALLCVFPALAGSVFAYALVGLILVASTQIVFMTLLSVTGSSTDTQKDSEWGTTLEKVMGVDDPIHLASDVPASLTDIRQEAMSLSAAKMGAQFLLSEREVEVLTLYAQGFTHKGVGKKLFISQGTVHTHIKRIYAKTGLHSRQELLEYLERYAS